MCSLRVLLMTTDSFLPRSWKKALAASFLEVERGGHTFKKTKGSPISLKALLTKLIREKPRRTLVKRGTSIHVRKQVQLIQLRSSFDTSLVGGCVRELVGGGMIEWLRVMVQFGH